MKAEPTTKALIEMLYDRHPEIFHRPQRPWVGLTADEVQDCFDEMWCSSVKHWPFFASAIEAKLKEKNT